MNNPQERCHRLQTQQLLAISCYAAPLKGRANRRTLTRPFTTAAARTLPLRGGTALTLSRGCPTCYTHPKLPRAPTRVSRGAGPALMAEISRVHNDATAIDHAGAHC